MNKIKRLALGGFAVVALVLGAAASAQATTPVADEGWVEDWPGGLGPPESPTWHVGTQPHANQNWHPRPDCINYNPVNGSIPAAFHVNDVIDEYRNKVANLPTLRDLNAGCPSGSNAVANIRVDYIPNPARNYCSRYAVGPDATHPVVQITDNGSCNNHEREWACSGVGFSVGAHGYRGVFTPRGCLWFGGDGPDHLSSGFSGSEAQKLNQAWS